MPRKTLIRSNHCPYHVTARCNNRESFYCQPDDVWRVFNWHLNEITKKFEVKIHAFVLMPNHFHLLISTPKDDLGVVMQYLILFVTKALNAKANRTGRVFGDRYHWSIIDTLDYYDYALKYVYRNPVKANIIERVEDYPFATIGGAIGKKRMFFPLSPPDGIQSIVPADDIEEFLRWLNQPFRKEHDDAIRKGFKKKKFSLSKVGWKRLPAIPDSAHDEKV